MRSFIPMLILGVPAVALGASTCPAAAPVHAPGGAPLRSPRLLFRRWDPRFRLLISPPHLP